METNAIAAIGSETGLACFDPKKSNPVIRRGLGELEDLRDADWYVQKGNAANREKRYREALQLYETALTINPDNCDALFWVGFCLEPSREWEAVVTEIYGRRWDIAIKRAIRYFYRMIEIDTGLDNKTNLSNAWVNLSFAYALLDDRDKKRNAAGKPLRSILMRRRPGTTSARWQKSSTE